MSLQSVPPLIFDFLPDLPLLVQPQEGQISSDAGLLPIAQFDRQWNYTARMAQCLSDPAPDPPLSLPFDFVLSILSIPFHRGRCFWPRFPPAR